MVEYMYMCMNELVLMEKNHSCSIFQKKDQKIERYIVNIKLSKLGTASLNLDKLVCDF